MLLSNINVLCIPNQFALPQAFSAFTEKGELADAKMQGMLEATITQLIQITKAIHG